MTCTHQWHDATTSAGPEWVCGKCKITYTETKKTLSAPKRGWVGLTDEDIEQVWRQVQTNDFHDCVQPFARAIEAKLRSKHT